MVADGRRCEMRDARCEEKEEEEEEEEERERERGVGPFLTRPACIIILSKKCWFRPSASRNTRSLSKASLEELTKARGKYLLLSSGRLSKRFL